MVNNLFTVRESAAKPNKLTTYQEGSETIPKGSTSLDSNNDGSASHPTAKDEGEEIVHGNEFYKQNFINRASELFNNKFDYSNVNYVSMKTPVEIICPEHGKFWQRPMDHLRNKFGCPECAKKYKTKTYNTEAQKKVHTDSQMTKEDFIQLANKKYNNRYKYVINDWNGLVNSKIIVICPKHGTFVTNARAHIMKNNIYGCPECAKEHRIKNKSFTYDDVIKQCKDQYGDYYEYPETNRNIYTNKQTKIQIICPKHGTFYKSVTKFLSGQECPKCKLEKAKENGYIPGGYNESWFSNHPECKEDLGILYYLKVNDLDKHTVYYKIGITKYQDPTNRIKSLKSSALRLSNKHLEFEVVSTKSYEMYMAYKLEQQILMQFKNIRKFTSWSSELFTEDIYENIKQYF